MNLVLGNASCWNSSLRLQQVIELHIGATDAYGFVLDGRSAMCVAPIHLPDCAAWRDGDD